MHINHMWWVFLS